jgi:hypothetical protein
MIGCCPLEEEPVAIPRPRRVVASQNKPKTAEDTECNYVVMFFIVGVLTLALMDTLEK